MPLNLSLEHQPDHLKKSGQLPDFSWCSLGRTRKMGYRGKIFVLVYIIVLSRFLQTIISLPFSFVFRD
jgi:hypothetical protein